MTKKAFFYSLRQTLPILFGYIFLGIAFGISLQQAGFRWLWALGISLLVYAGSMQFMLVSLLSSGASLLAAGVMTLGGACHFHRPQGSWMGTHDAGARRRHRRRSERK